MAKVKILGTRDESQARSRAAKSEGRLNSKLVRMRVTTKEMLDTMRERLGITVVDLLDLMVTREWRDPNAAFLWEEWIEKGTILSPVQKWMRMEKIVWETLYQETTENQKILRIKLYELSERLVPDRLSKAQFDKMLMNLHKKELVKYHLPDEVWIPRREETYGLFLASYPSGS